MTSQADADNLAHQIGDIRRASGEEMTDEAFGRMNWETWRAAMDWDSTPWDKLASLERGAWIASAAAVRKEDAELRKEVAGETGWLVEITHPVEQPQWMAAVMGVGRWTSDAAKAIRFARKQDAVAVIDSLTRNGLAGPGFAIATEHQWG